VSGLPKGWTTATIVNLIAPDGIFSDGDWVESKDQDPAGSIRLLQLADVGDGVFVGKSNRFVNNAKFEQLRFTEVFEGDVLIARMPDPLGRACLAPKLRQRCISVVDVAIVRPGPQSARTKWLMHFLNSPQVRQVISVQSSGTTRRRISRGNLAQLELPLPPLPEQKRIADKLDALLARVDACRERLDRVPKILKRFRQSVLAAATSGELTREWREARGLGFAWTTSRLGSVGSVTGGITKNLGRVNAPLKRKYLRVANVYANRLELDDIAEIATNENEFARTQVKYGDVLIVEGNGSIDQIGRAALWRGEIPDCSHQNHLIRWRSNGTLEPAFALYWLLSPLGRESLVKFAKSSTGLHTLNLSKVSAMPVLVPPFNEQMEIVRRVEALFEIVERLEYRITCGHELIAGATPTILAKAFRGELVPQDPNDEPASELLARIRSQMAVSGGAKPKRGPNVKTRWPTTEFKQ